MNQNKTPGISWSGNPIYNSTDNIALKCVIRFDRDSVLDQDLNSYCYRLKDFDPIPNSLEAIAFRKLGHKIVIITNQDRIVFVVSTTDFENDCYNLTATQ